MGYCCSFNYFRKNRTTLPLFAHTFGLGGGISIIGTGNPQLADGKSGIIFGAGFMLFIHHPYDFPVEASQMTFIGVGYETLIPVHPTVTLCTDQVLALSEKARNCIVASDIGVDFYRKSDCSLACLRSAVYDNCGCHPFYLPRAVKDDGRYQDCRAIDAECFDKNFCKYSSSNYLIIYISELKVMSNVKLFRHIGYLRSPYNRNILI